MEIYSASYAYFSVKQRELAGSCFYFDLDGKEVEVTEVSNISPGDIKRNFSDFKYIGLVGKWSREGTKLENWDK